MATRITKGAAAEDPAEALVRQMPPLRRDDAVVWLCRTFGFDPMLLESAQAKGWVECDPVTGLWAGAPAAEADGEPDGDGGDLPFVPAAAAPAVPAEIDDPSGYKLF